MKSAASGPRLTTVMRIRISSGRDLGVFDENIEVAIFVENAGVDQLELRLAIARRGWFSSDAATRRETRACGYLYRYFM